MAGKKTMLANALVCQSCGGTTFVEDKRLKRSVSFRCAKCGLPTSVKGAVIQLRAPEDEVRFALSGKRFEPESPSDSEESGEGKGEAKIRERGYRTFRFRVSLEENDLIQDALEMIRIKNFANEDFRRQDWQGRALAWMAADYKSGEDPAVIEVVEAMRREADEEARKLRESTGRALTARRRRDIKARIRDKMLKRLDGEEEEEDFPKDRGRLMTAVKAAFRQYAEEIGEEVECAFRERGDLGDCVRLWEKYGGYILRIDGDPRITGKHKKSPLVFVWMELDEAPDIAKHYREIMSAEEGGGAVENPQIEIVELLLPDQYDEWDAPQIAQGRAPLKREEDHG